MGRGFDLAYGIVDGRGDQILEYVLVFRQQGGIQVDALDVVPTGHHHFHHARAGFAFDLERGDGLLRFLHVVLHRLRLLHQIGKLVLHRGSSFIPRA